MQRRALLGIAILIITLIVTATTYATVPGDVRNDQTKYDNALSASATMSIDNGTASLKGRLTGKTGVTKIKCTLTLQKKESGNWNNVESWSKEVNATSITFTKTRSVSHGTYRTKAKFKVYKGGTCETITKYSSQATY